MTLPAPFAPLVSGGDGLEKYPDEASALRARMAEIYRVAPGQVLLVRGLTHGLELVWRLAARDGGSVQAPAGEPFGWLSTVYPARGDTIATVIRALGSLEAVTEMAQRVAPALLVVDEGLIEFSDAGSAVALIAEQPNLVVLRSLSLAYGLAGRASGRRSPSRRPWRGWPACSSPTPCPSRSCDWRCRRWIRRGCWRRKRGSGPCAPSASGCRARSAGSCRWSRASVPSWWRVLRMQRPCWPTSRPMASRPI
ncbi:hypothetical protein [Brevundimonas sp. PAMC22021]|uniref:hypothetical protein n=1 Tax=Brevundimonas sp. PAMC22021 TaxID=2861285 RepID=UPI002102ED78|nr:hypothetical protein [Brevundimonas sp. PAMC22021]